jgi:hypothetical protein
MQIFFIVYVVTFFFIFLFFSKIKQNNVYLHLQMDKPKNLA